MREVQSKWDPRPRGFSSSCAESSHALLTSLNSEPLSSTMARLRRPRKRPLTNLRPHASVSHRVTKSTISSFHSLSKQRARLESQLAAGTSKSQEQLIASLQQVNADFEELGGLVGYQDASRLGQTGERGGDSSKILIEWLRDRAGGGVKGKGRDTTQDHAEHRLRFVLDSQQLPSNETVSFSTGCLRLEL